MVADVTRPAAEAETTVRDVVVVGAGPAGALSATLLARRGADVLLVDRETFPRWTVCGACLGPAGVGVLADAGLEHVLDAAEAPRAARMVIQGWDRRVELPLEGGRVLSRARLDQALAAAAVGAGAEFRPGTTARLGPPGREGQEVHLERRGDVRVVRCRVVVAATGLHPLPRVGVAEVPRFRRREGSRIGVGALVSGWDDYGPEVGTVRMTAGEGGYVGQVRQEDGRWVVAAALDPERIRGHGGPGPAVEALLAGAGVDPSGWSVEAGWRGTPALTGAPVRRARGRVYVVGDAAGYVEPFTGEGMSWALAGGRALVPVVLDALRRREAVADGSWDRRYRDRVGRRQRLCRGIAWLSRRPRLAAEVLGLLERAPWLARPALLRVAGGHA